MKLLLLTLIALSFSAFAGIDDFEPSIKTCNNTGKLKKAAKKADISKLAAQKICRVYLKDLADTATDTKINGTTDDKDIDDLLEALGLKRNVYALDLRIRFTQALSPSITEGAETAREVLQAVDTWPCIIHQPFNGSDLSGSAKNETTGIAFSVLANLIQDDSGYKYGYRNNVELAGADRNNENIRSIRYEYFCEKEGNENCTVENYDQRVLYIEETLQGPGLITYISNYLSGGGIDAEEAVMQLLRNKAVPALNNITNNQCSDFRLFTGCEMVVNYYECFEDVNTFFQHQGFKIF